MKLRILSAHDIATSLPMADAIAATRQAFADFTSGRAQVPQRTVMQLGDDEQAGTVLVKPAYVPEVGLGAKLASVFPGNAEHALPVTPGIVLLLSPLTGEPEAILDGTFLTAWRTGAASGAATELLALRDAKVGAVFGAGTQARTQILAIDCAREFDEIRIFARTASAVEALVDELQTEARARLVATDSPSAAIADADVVCTATTSKLPVFDGLHLKEGAHINGVGSYTPQMQEIDLETVLRSRIFVDSVASASLEPGDLLEALAAGITNPAEWTELGTVVLNDSRGREEGDDITFFKSVGLAVQDIACGGLALSRSLERGLGREIEF